MVSKDQSIVIQVAAKIAAELTPKTDDVNANIVAFSQAFDSCRELILGVHGFDEVNTSTTTNTSTATEVEMVKQAFPNASQSGAGFNIRIKGKQHGPIPEWLPAMCQAKGVTEVWDNRDGLSVNPKRPWFKSTTSEDAFWAPRN
jgi:hypothetical protein